jgi:uncharacterized protein YndB with AHSA1/START domain
MIASVDNWAGPHIREESPSKIELWWSEPPGYQPVSYVVRMCRASECEPDDVELSHWEPVVTSSSREHVTVRVIEPGVRIRYRIAFTDSPTEHYMSRQSTFATSPVTDGMYTHTDLHVFATLCVAALLYGNW